MRTTVGIADGSFGARASTLCLVHARKGASLAGGAQNVKLSQAFNSVVRTLSYELIGAARTYGPDRIAVSARISSMLFACRRSSSAGAAVQRLVRLACALGDALRAHTEAPETCPAAAGP